MAEPPSGDEMKGVVLETSAACQLSCPFCFLRSYRERPEAAEMSEEVVRAVEPFLARLRSVDLTGWGEPLLNPALFSIIARVRRVFAGRLTLTTNGLLLDAGVMERLIDFGVDTVCVSVDAATAESYQGVRPGGDFALLCARLAEFVHRRQKRKQNRPLIFATFLLRRSALPELPDFVQLAVRLGLEGVVFQQLTGVFSVQGLTEVTHSAYYGNKFDESDLATALAQGQAVTPPGFIIVCPEKIGKRRLGGCGGFDLCRPFITASGQVSVCCAMAYPCALLRRDGRLEKTRAVVFGNVRERSLPEVWRDPIYVETRTEIRSGAIPCACGDCIALYMKPGVVWQRRQ